MTDADRRQQNLELIRGYTIRSRFESPDAARVAAELRRDGTRYSSEPFARVDPSTAPGPGYWGNLWNNWSGIRPTSSRDNAVEGEIGFSLRLLDDGKWKKPASPYAVFDSANSFFAAKSRTFLSYETADPTRSFHAMIERYKTNGGAGYTAQQIVDLVTARFDPEFKLDVSKPPNFRENPELLAKLMAAHPTFESGKSFSDAENSIFTSLDGVRGASGWDNAYLAARIGVIQRFEILREKGELPPKGIEALDKMTQEVAGEIRTRLGVEKAAIEAAKLMDGCAYAPEGCDADRRTPAATPRDRDGPAPSPAR